MMDHPSKYTDPTGYGDDTAAEMRAYYEANTPGWYERFFGFDRNSADNLMLGLAAIAIRRQEEYRRLVA